MEDEELAAFTDRLLSGHSAMENRPPLAEVVEALAQTMRPRPVPEGLRYGLRRRLAAEWDRQYGAPRRFLALPPPALRIRRTWVAAAALVLILLAAAVMLPSGVRELSGTAAGKAGGVVVIGLVAAAGALAAIWLATHRRS